MNRPTVPLTLALSAVLLAFFMGAAVTYRNMTAGQTAPTRFNPGRYIVEPERGNAEDDAWIVNYSTAWYVQEMPARP